MPRVPSYGSQKVSQAPLPGVRRQAAPTAASMGGGVADMVTRMGLQKFTEIADREKVKADWTMLREAENGLYAFEQSLHEGENAPLRRQGHQALQVADEVRTQLDQRVSDIQSRLTNDEQRQRFADIAHRFRANIGATLVKFEAGEIERVQLVEGQARVQNGLRAVIEADSPARRGQELAFLEASIADMAVLQGFPRNGERTTQLLTEITSQAHRGVIERILAGGQDRAASAYFDEVKDQIIGADRTELERQIGVASTDADGMQAAAEIWLEAGPKSDHDAINFDVMEAAARDRFGNDAKAFKATMAALRERYAVVTTARRERDEANEATVWGAVNSGLALRKVQTMPEYLRLSGAQQLKVTSQMVAQQEAAADRGRASARRADEAKERRGWARYWELSEPGNLAGMSENAIVNLQGEIGIEHVNRLLEKKRSLAKGETAVRDATIDSDLFSQNARALTGINPYATLNAEQKEQLGQLRYQVEQAIDAFQRAHNNRAATRDEKDTIMRDVLKATVMQSNWGSDTAVPAAVVVNPKTRASAYVPIDQVPESFVTQALAHVRGFSRDLMRMPDDELRRRYTDRIQRAYARRLMNGTRTEIEDALKGY